MWQGIGKNDDNIISHSCIHDEIIERRRRQGHKVYSVMPQVYEGPDISKPLQHKGRALLGISKFSEQQNNAKQPIRIYLNYDAVGHSPDRDCRSVGDIVKASVIIMFVTYSLSMGWGCGTNVQVKPCVFALNSLGSLL